MKRKKQRNGQCVYCGQIGPITEDHVPPKNLYAKPRPNNLIKVPSCNLCNQSASDDDEYFRSRLTFREDVYNHPDVQQILPTVIRSLTKPQKVGFKNAFLNNIHKVNLITTNGLFFGKKGAYDVDLSRLDRVAGRIAKGLFYREMGVRLPDEYDVVTYSESGLREITDQVRCQIKTAVLTPLIANKPKIIGNEVFCYWFSFVDKDPNMSAWLLLFYQRIAFLCLTLPQEILTRANKLVK